MLKPILFGLSFALLVGCSESTSSSKPKAVTYEDKKITLERLLDESKGSVWVADQQATDEAIKAGLLTEEKASTYIGEGHEYSSIVLNITAQESDSTTVDVAMTVTGEKGAYSDVYTELSFATDGKISVKTSLINSGGCPYSACNSLQDNFVGEMTETLLVLNGSGAVFGANAKQIEVLRRK